MGLNLGNNLTGLVSREVDASNRRLSSLGSSMTTGSYDSLPVVDAFLGNSLRDSEKILGAVARSTNYVTNMLTIADEYLKTIGNSLQDGLMTIGSAGPVSEDKLSTLQKNLDDKRTQVALLLSTADFDGKSLLGGGAQQVDIQVGLALTDKVTISITDYADGKLFRTSITDAINEWLAADETRSTYYANASEIATDLESNINLVSVGLANAGGSGTGGAMTSAELAAAIVAVRDANADYGTFLNAALPTLAAFMDNANAGVSFSNGTNVQIQAAIDDGTNLADLVRPLLGDDVATTISDSTDTAAKTIAQDVFTNALNTIRKEQASVTNQKENILEATDALRATTNVTQAAADSYLKTDYVLAAQEYSELLKRVVAAVATLQANNKPTEATQRLVDGLVR